MVCDDLEEKMVSFSLEEWKLLSELLIGKAIKEIRTCVGLKKNLDDVTANDETNRDDLEYFEERIAQERTIQDVKFVPARTLHT